MYISATRAIRTRKTSATGTAAAAYGGVTTVFDIAQYHPPVGTKEVLAEKHKLASEAAHVDYGLYGLLGEDTIANVPDSQSPAHHRFKLYMAIRSARSVADDRRHAGSFRGGCANRQAHLAACRNQFHHGTA